MALYISEAMRVLEEGRQFRRDQTANTAIPYRDDAERKRWFARGWLEVDKEITDTAA